MTGDAGRDLDTVIDRVVRAMTGAAPPEDLRRRVMHSIAMPRQSYAGRRAWSVVAVATVLMLVLVAIFSTWRVQPPREPVTRVAIEPVPPTGSSTAEPEPPRRSAAPQPRRHGADTPRTVALMQTPVPVAESTVDVKPVAIAPLVTEPVQVSDVPVPPGVEIDPITVKPLSITVDERAFE